MAVRLAEQVVPLSETAIGVVDQLVDQLGAAPALRLHKLAKQTHLLARAKGEWRSRAWLGLNFDADRSSK